MPEAITQLAPLMIAAYRRPSITAYNRLELSPRTEDFERSLKAEVRDALWMLTRQWQFGEFQGEDSGSPITAQILGAHDMIDRVQFPQNKLFSYDPDLPMEAKVEREKITSNLYLGIQMNRYFVKLLKSKGIESYRDKLITKYNLSYIIDKNDTEAVQVLNALKGNAFDGYALLQDILTIDSGSGDTKFNTWVDSEASISSGDKTILKGFALIFKDWVDRTYSQPADTGDSSWIYDQLEYQFAVSTPPSNEKQQTLVANRFYGGHLDWYSFDLDIRKRMISPDIKTPTVVHNNFVSFIPSPVSFKGMPNPRFWQMEESQTDFGKIDTSTTGLMHLLFAEFGLIYSNDWFMLPYPMQINTICQIRGILITDVFGEHILIRPAGLGPETDWHRWVMFHHTENQNPSVTHNVFYLAPALTKTLESEPLEKVNFLRDEMANMVWAVEETVPSQAGIGISGKEMALQDTVPEIFTPTGDAKIKYVLGTLVPDNWIPFIPVHMEGSVSEIHLQRAKMPASKGAKGIILTEKEAPFFINEEEVPRSGSIVQRSFKRVRWLNGKTYLWIGRYRETGKGEGWSNLKFDQIEDIKSSA